LNLDNYTGSWQVLGGTIRGGQVSTDYFQGDPAARDDYYDAGQGFSNTQNGAWSYGWTPTLGGAFALGTHHTDFEGDETWAGNLDGQGDPFVALDVYQAEQDGVPVASIPPILTVEQAPGMTVQRGTGQRSFSFNVGFSDGAPVGGSAQLTVNADGTYTFSGHLHDSGFPSYDATLTIGLESPSGLLVPFTQMGHMAGTVGGGGPATLRAGTGTDILIGGSTIYDNNLPALLALMSAWGRTDIDYQQRVQDLFGPTGGYSLNAQTVVRDAAVTQLMGANSGLGLALVIGDGNTAGPYERLRCRRDFHV